MIDFENSVVFKLLPVDTSKMIKSVEEFFIDGEEVIAVFQIIRDQLIFTNKRIITVNIKGVTGRKTDYTSIPYGKIHIFSIETAGILDIDCELEFVIIGLGQVKFEIIGQFDIIKFNKTLSELMLR